MLSNSNSEFQQLLIAATHVQEDLNTENAISLPSSAPSSVTNGIAQYKQELQDALSAINNSTLLGTIESAINGLMDQVTTLQGQVSTLQSQVSELQSLPPK